MISGKLFAVFVLMYINVNMALPVPDENSLTPYLNKKYKLVSSDDKFEEVMEVLGVEFLKRKLAHLSAPVIELTEKNGEYTFTPESTFKNVILKFRLGEEFEEVTPDDRIVKIVITQVGNKLIQVQVVRVPCLEDSGDEEVSIPSVIEKETETASETETETASETETETASETETGG